MGKIICKTDIEGKAVFTVYCNIMDRFVSPVPFESILCASMFIVGFEDKKSFNDFNDFVENHQYTVTETELSYLMGKHNLKMTKAEEIEDVYSEYC